MATLGAGALTLPNHSATSWATGKKSPLRVAIIGVGGRGVWVMNQLNRIGAVCTCYADVDTRKSRHLKNIWPSAVEFQDYRKLFDEMSDEFDAVAIATPDHHHFPAALLTLQHNKGCYLEKPMALTMEETRYLAQEAERRRLPTQVGNQGQANMGNRLTYSWIKGGYIGDLKEVHAWTDRPWWPQGLERPEGEDVPIPEYLDWDVWLGPAPYRPYRHEPSTRDGTRGVYHHFNWRGWWDFGAGPLGDMGAHTLNAMFWILYPKYPLSIETLHSSGFNGDSLPEKASIKYVFPGDQPGTELPIYWYEGGLMPARPETLEEERELTDTGIIYYGSDGSILGDSHGRSSRIFPEEKMRSIGRPELLQEPSPGHVEEWVMACQGETAWDSPLSSFHRLGAYINEMLCLGVLAYRLEQGEKFGWDPATQQITNKPQLNEFLSREYRPGWDFRTG